MNHRGVRLTKKIICELDAGERNHITEPVKLYPHIIQAGPMDFKEWWVDKGFADEYGYHRQKYLKVPCTNGFKDGEMDCIWRQLCRHKPGDLIWVSEKKCRKEDTPFWLMVDSVHPEKRLNGWVWWIDVHID